MSGNVAAVFKAPSFSTSLWQDIWEAFFAAIGFAFVPSTTFFFTDTCRSLVVAAVGRAVVDVGAVVVVGGGGGGGGGGGATTVAVVAVVAVAVVAGLVVVVAVVVVVSSCKVTLVLTFSPELYRVCSTCRFGSSSTSSPSQSIPL